MRRIAALLLGVFVGGTAHAQVGQIPTYLQPAPAAPAGYTGPGDIISYDMYFGLRAYSAATRGQKLINACNSTGGVDVGCADLSSDATTGRLVPATISGITCPGANCTIKIYYDLLGANACNSLTCDETQTTISARDTLDSSCAPLSVSVCATSQGSIYFNPNNYAPLNGPGPIFLSASWKMINNGTEQAVIGGFGSATQLFNWSHSGVPSVGFTANFASQTIWVATADGYHATAGLYDGAGSAYAAVDQGTVATGAMSITPQSTPVGYHGDGFSNDPIAGSKFLEAGVASSAPSSATAQLVNANSQTFWGF